MAIYLDRADEKIKYDSEGVSRYELLPGVYKGGIINYRCNLKAGSVYSPELYEDKIVVLFFGRGKGYITDPVAAHNINELCFYSPNFDKDPYTVYAIEDMEFILSVVDMNQWDWEVFNGSHARLPFFRTISKCFIYDQDCKGPHTDSYNVLIGKQLGRIMIGAVRANGEGTVEKGHAAVAQWNYCVGDSDFTLTVDGESVNTKAGDFSYVPAGLDHSLVADPGKEVYYVWYEHFTKEKDFIVKPLPENV